MPANGMIEFRPSGVVLVVTFFVEIEVRVQLAAVFGGVSMEERLVHQPCQKAGYAVGHGCRAAHADILMAAFWQVNAGNSEENFRVRALADWEEIRGQTPQFPNSHFQN